MVTMQEIKSSNEEKKKYLGENKIWEIVDKRKAIEKRILIFKQILKVKNEEKYRKVKIQKL